MSTYAPSDIIISEYSVPTAVSITDITNDLPIAS